MFFSVYRLPSLQTKVNSSTSLTVDPSKAGAKKHMDVELCDVVALAKEALSASKEAASLVEESKIIEADSDDSHSLGLVSCSYLVSLLSLSFFPGHNFWTDA